MKTIFTFAILAVAASLLSFGARAQTNQSQILGIARVLDQLEVGGPGFERNLDFGIVLAGEVKTVPVDGPATSLGSFVASNDGVTSGAFGVRASPDTQINLSFDLPGSLIIDGPGTEFIDINTFTAGLFSGVVLGGDAPVDAVEGGGSTFTPGPSTVINLEDSQIGPDNAPGFWVRIGATIEVPVGAPVGRYEGTITLTADYN
ncbi:hypothetical protein A3SI_02908 [Nitritalea halalkaliphila LW7]|uniref:DUF4402 domain-containing protein n=1 Tax=Nitritalea halalkaliphila LW7 TaxID=1189621 RepID=I5C9H0_9BACT|nr:DUF4402 domain-containing protein [Nitritalea halalkaliphila]EIM78472.1 hypothetical protein A3SI_02908 [Nitritalea halalkaliphila LW7]